MAHLLDQRTARFHRRVHGVSQVYPFDMQRDLAPGNPADIEQIVEQARHVLQLALHHRQHGLRLWLGTRHSQDLDAVADRCERIAQLVGEAREELVLAAIRLSQSRHPPADEHEPGKCYCHHDELEHVQTQHFDIVVAGVAAPGHQREASQRYRAENGEPLATGAQHAEHQRDEKESGEGESGVRSAVDDEKHREHGGKKLESGQAGIRKPQIEPEAEKDEKSENGRRDDCGSLEKRLAVNLVLCVKDGQHHQVQRRERAGEQEPAEPKALVDFVPCQ